MLRAVSEVPMFALPERDANPFYQWDGFERTALPQKLTDKVERVSPKKRRLEEVDSSQGSQALLESINKVESIVLEEVPLGPPPRSDTSKSLTPMSWDSEDEDFPPPNVGNVLPHKLHYLEEFDFHEVSLGNQQLK